MPSELVSGGLSDATYNEAAISRPSTLPRHLRDHDRAPFRVSVGASHANHATAVSSPRVYHRIPSKRGK
jgi:hypothetical protein